MGIEVTGKPVDYFIPSVLYALGGIGITWVLRRLFRAVWNLKPLPLVTFSALGSMLAATAFTGFRSLVYFGYYDRGQFPDLSLSEYFNPWDLYISLYVIGTWSGLYFGVRYYHTVQQQKERLLKATIAAHNAQLQMLRYQLNPHFLFNTLNAIATLVLEGDREGAGNMVSALSAFLRHGLDSDPMQKVTLKEELEVLELYLDIEKTRFEDLLQVRSEIDPSARDALMPRMLLQPLVEHVIRHGIAGTEDGGTISIAAFIEDGKLCLRVADDAHGRISRDVIRTSGTTSNGLDSMRERLGVLYGSEQDLTLDSPEPNGLGLTIKIPLEQRNRQNT